MDKVFPLNILEGDTRLNECSHNMILFWIPTIVATCPSIGQAKHNSSILQCGCHLPDTKVERMSLMSPSLNEYYKQVMIHIYMLKICNVIKTRLHDIWDHRIWKRYQLIKSCIIKEKVWCISMNYKVISTIIKHLFQMKNKHTFPFHMASDICNFYNRRTKGSTGPRSMY
jgi:hypothetical protein